MDNKEMIIEAVKADRLYDCIANHYWEMSKDELKTVLLEVIVASETDNESLLEELEERL